MKDRHEISDLISLDKKRILLWDIDGTLMSSTVQGSFKKYFAETMKELFGSAGKIEKITPSGMTDIQIIYEALKEEGFSPEQILERKTELLEIFEKNMKDIVGNDKNPYKKFSGADEILSKTEKNPFFINSLLTGNLSVAAKVKLSNVNLWHYFENAPNSYGEISHKRNDLAIEAGKNFNENYKYKFDPAQFIVIGDTPNDIICARAFGAKIISVATGRNHPVEELEKYNPDVVLENLEDTEKILSILETL